MNPSDIKSLYEYNRWANARVLEALSPLSMEQFTRDLGGSFPSIRDTLTHILSGEWIWLMRWKGMSPRSMWKPQDFPDVNALKERWAEVEREQIDFVRGLTEESLDTRISYMNTQRERWEYPLSRMMQHVVTHSTYHRGQVASMLRRLDVRPAATDYLVFFDLKSP